MYWYEDEVKRLEKDKLKLTYNPETIFYGSSTFRLWNTLYDDFNEIKPVNLGFGGSTLAACDWFFERIMSNFEPKKLVVYAGDNDLGDGRHPEEVFLFFLQLMVKVENRFGNIPCYFVSLKPSPARWNIIEQFKFTNNIIETEIIKRNANWHFIDIFKEMIDASGKPRKDFYVADGLHLSNAGYDVWRRVIHGRIIDR
jgi:lysophospholipase L1-like esterase